MSFTPMHLNRLVEQVLSEAAVELLDTLAANALADEGSDKSALCYLAVEPDAWNGTLLLLREIFEAEILLSGEPEWLGFRILQSCGVKDGKLAYQFTPTFARALATG